MVACGNSALVNPPELMGVETPSEATIVCNGNVFTFKLDQDLNDNGGIFLVIEATKGQSNGMSRAHNKAVAIKLVEEPSDAVIDIAAEYVAKHGALSAAAPKVFFRFYFVNSATGEKSGVMLAECKWAADGSEQAAGEDNGGSQNQGGSGSGSSTNQGGSDNSQSGSGQGSSQTSSVEAPVITAVNNPDAGPRVTITGPAGAEIHYTRDGSTPTAESTLYTSSIEASTGTTFKAIAILNGVSSEVTTYVVPGFDDDPIGSDH